MTAGDDQRIAFQIVDDAGDPLDVTGWAIACRVVLSEEADAETLFSKSLASGGISMTDATTGQGEVIVDAIDTTGYGTRELPLMIETIDLAGERETNAAGCLSLTARLPG